MYAKVKRLGILIVFLLLLCFFPLKLNAQQLDEKTLRIGIFAKAFAQYPDKKGVTWANSVIEDVFVDAGFQIEVVVRPIGRLPVSLKRNLIDTYYSSLETGRSIPNDFLNSAVPVLTAPFVIYYNRLGGWQPIWPPDSAFLSKKGVSSWSSKSFRKFYGLDVTQINSFDATIKMVNAGRADYFIEAPGPVKGMGDDLFGKKEDGFVMEYLYSRLLYAWFQPTERGRKLLEIFNKGHLKMLRAGALAKSYNRNLPVAKRVSQERFDRAIARINKEHPTLNIPRQLTDAD